MIAGLTNAGSIPVLERTMQFAGQRHALIVHNIANLSTPDYRPLDVSVSAFQKQLGEAMDDRRARHGNRGGELKLPSSSEVEVNDREMTLHPTPAGENILFHDENDRDLERTMQHMVENFTMYRSAAQFLRREFETLNLAIRERL